MTYITVFTPTYNRASCLPQCYQSLLEQNPDQFIWQVIDDGSVDDTPEVMRHFMAESKIKIDYVRRENKGKASAINMSINRTKTPYWLCLDSDDYLVSGAIDIIANHCASIANNNHIGGLVAVRSNKALQPMAGKQIPISVTETNLLEVRYKLKVPPEYVLVYKTSILQEFNFPRESKDKFMPESWLQDQMDQRYTLKVVREPLMVCVYRSDGLTKNYYNLIRSNPSNMMLYYWQRYHLSPYFRPKLVAALFYNAVAMIQRPNKTKRTGLMVALIPFSYILYFLRLRS